MARRTSALLAGIGALAASAFLLVGCATPSAGGPESMITVGPGATGEPGVPGDVAAAWLDDGRAIGIVTQGSSTCVPQAGDVSIEGQTITVDLVNPEAQACTADFAPRVTLVATPESIDLTSDVTIVTTGAIEGQGVLAGSDTLTGTPGDSTDYLPSAGWTGAEGEFVILTWGSSSCAPVIEEVVASGAAEVTVTYKTPAADQICTMDMAPRAAIAFVSGLETQDDAFAVLVGTPEFDNVRVPIRG
ncbi:hypothetical protein [Microbacterium ulmi]|uniref:Uncharacterized protein n=1 Tax=Microbacterium ulmi TaxID=179095 RepID=A0A7Y2LZG7_9MICO|nr:hypothetical protein [Microbacterium ulmi]NII69800.1 hypothetical protein [Microbacterium ulmi]NNH03229.1 hypothetical protein [Microbacterium ulmi]